MNDTPNINRDSTLDLARSRQHPPAARNGTLVVVHRQPLVADALTACLSTRHDLTVLAHGNSGVEAISLARSYQPQMILLDESVDDAPTKVVLASIALHSLHTTIVLLRTAAGRSSRWSSPIIVGEHPQTNNLGDLVALVTFALTERKPTDAIAAPQSPSSQLVSRRETSVLALVALGRTNSQIAAELYISDSTVKRHLANIYAKLEVHSRVAAVRQAHRLGIVEVY